MSSARVFFQLCVKIKISQPLQQLLKRLLSPQHAGKHGALAQERIQQQSLILLGLELLHVGKNEVIRCLSVDAWLFLVLVTQPIHVALTPDRTRYVAARKMDGGDPQG